jgi:transmembrane sensor
VRRDDLRTAITLMEGKVAVSSSLLAPGERLTFVEGEAPVRDRPSLAMLTAWQRGKVAIDNLTLAEAAAEMNRYSERPLMVGPDVAALRVSGIFRAGDSVGFAGAVARSYGLLVRESSRRITLSGPALEAK